jgi:hypothetical protein
MIHYDDLFYGNLSGGRLDGYCAITLELGTEKSTSARALLSTILSFGRTRIFRIIGKHKASTHDELYTLLSTLKENNYITFAVLDGQVKEEWMDELTFRVVTVSEAPWLMFAAAEVHFQPIAKENLQAPSLAEVHQQATWYLDVNRDLSASEIFEFLKKNPLWRIFSPPSKTYRMALPMKEED